MYRTYRGFTLVELMVIVSVVAILAAIAVPTYQAYAVRSRISEALAMMGACKTAVTDYLTANAALPPDVSSAGCAGYAGTQYVAAIDVAVGTGTITVTMANTGKLGLASSKTVKLTPSVNSSNMISAWACAPGDSDPIPDNLLPGPCR
jgi:type IV pilus assembly protein PilA